MTTLTFSPPFSPSAGAQDKPEFKILQAEFGDGYSQSTPAGLNHIRSVLTLTWELLEAGEKDDMVAFFRRHDGTKPFRYALPGELHRAWTCADYTVTAQGASMFNITATFRQFFGSIA